VRHAPGPLRFIPGTIRRRFMGSPPMNLLRVGLEANADGIALVLGSQRLDVPTSYCSSHDLPTVDGPGVVSVFARGRRGIGRLRVRIRS